MRMQPVAGVVVATFLILFPWSAQGQTPNSNYPSNLGGNSHPTQPVTVEPMRDYAYGTNSAGLLDKFEGARKLEARKQALAQSARLQVLTEQFEKDTKDRVELTFPDLKRLNEIVRLAKSIKGKLEE